MRLEVGEFYLSAGGEIVEIYEHRENHSFPFLSINGISYKEDGAYDYCMSPCRFDLIAHIPKELHWSIVGQVYSYYKNVNARNKIIRRHKNFFNKKKIIMPD